MWLWGPRGWWLCSGKTGLRMTAALVPRTAPRVVGLRPPPASAERVPSRTAFTSYSALNGGSSVPDWGLNPGQADITTC